MAMYIKRFTGKNRGGFVSLFVVLSQRANE